MKNKQKYCKFVSQVKSSPKIVFLINNSLKIFLISILLFSICCKPKQEPTEETYNGLIPKEFSEKYILTKNDGSYNYDDYFETTSSNFIIYSKYASYTKPIVLKDANAYNGFSIIGKAIVYYEDVDKPDKSYTFFTNKKDSKRILILGSLSSSGWWIWYEHTDDINK